MRLPSRSFWIAQGLGWALYALILFFSSIGALSNPSAAIVEHGRIKLALAATGFVTSLGLWALYDRLLPRRPRPAALLAVAVAASLLLGVVWSVLVRQVLYPGRPVAEAFKGATNYGITLLAWSALFFAFSWRRQLEAESERALRATALASEARLEMLRYQIHPHFLFNALNSIRALIDENPARARETVTELAEFFRYSLLSKGDDPSLGGELDAIRNYLAIQKIRFEERLEVSFYVSDDAAATRLPGFLVHPLVENAVKHGMETSRMPLEISLSAARDGGRLRVEVANTGTLQEAPDPARASGTGTGLANIRERLRQLFPGRHRFTLDEAGGRVHAVLEIDLPDEAEA